MAAITITWNPQTPAGTDNIKDGDDVIVALKKGVGERLANGGHLFPTIASGATLVATDGRHSCGASFTAGSSELAGEFNIYERNGTTVLAVFRDSAAATPSELFMGANGVRSTGTIKAATLNATSIIRPDTNNAVDLGLTGTRFKDLWLAGNATIGGTLAVTDVATFTATPVFNSAITVAGLTTGGIVGGLHVLTSTTTLDSTHYVVMANVTGGSFTINLPAAASNTGRHYIIQINRASGGSAFTLTLDPNGAEVIEHPELGNVTTWALRRNTTNDYYGAHIVSNGTSWELLNVLFVPT